MSYNFVVRSLHRPLVSIDFALQEPRRRPGSLIRVREVCGSNSERSDANQVTSSTVYLQVIAGIARNITTILGVLSVTEEHDTLDLIANRSRELGDSSRNNSCTLTAEMLVRELRVERYTKKVRTCSHQQRWGC
jgi:hypothetical protein